MKLSLSDNIKFLRESKGLKQEYVALKLEVTQQAYSKMEKNPESMTLKRLIDLSKILDVSLVTLLGEDNVFIQQNYNQSGGHAATQMVLKSATETIDIYERYIDDLKKQLTILEEIVKRV